MKESILIPSNDFPITHLPRGAVTNWLWESEREGYRIRKSPRYSEYDIEYRLNAHGYRTSEFNHFEGLRVLSIGCSYAFGYGLPQHEIFSEVFFSRLQEQYGKPAIHWNLGLFGASNDYITRVLQLVVPRLNPDLVLINFTWAARREYITANEEHYHYIARIKPEWSGVKREIYRYLTRLASAPDDQLNVFRNYKAVENLLRDRYWYFSAVDIGVLKMIEHHVDWGRFVGDFLSKRTAGDLARDMSHPGEQVHRQIGEAYFNRLMESGHLDTLVSLKHGEAHKVMR